MARSKDMGLIKAIAVHTKQNIFTSPKSTTIGASLLMADQINSTGFDLPANQNEWISFGIRMALMLLMAWAKDATK